jgi:hypothetical protein
VTDTYPFHYDMPRLRISDSEIVVQKQCLDMIARLFPRTRVAAVPNGQKRTRWQQMQAKREGMSAGFPDLILVGPSCKDGNYNPPFQPVTAFVELKAQAPMTQEQKDWLLFLMDCGHNCGVFRSDVTLEAKMREWGFR